MTNEGFDELATLSVPNLDRLVQGTTGQLASWQNNERVDPQSVAGEDSNYRAGGRVEQMDVT